ncbi:cyclic 2,3-diphosphoglycerate synthase [Planctomycetota bacterium]
MADKIIIMGAAGRDFHNFNVCFRDNPRYEVVAFTATQIPGIDDRRYPAVLSGNLYPQGIPIHPAEQLVELIGEHQVDVVVFSYSDVLYTEVMHQAAVVNAAGAHFALLGALDTMLESKKPIISVCAIRTGCGKSQTTRKICRIMIDQGKKVVAVRHPMPYGDLAAQAVQRFADYEDFEKHKCTIEEREEYEPLVGQGIVVYAGVDYGQILQQAEQEADVIIWDGGNNDTSFYKPDVQIIVFDPHRAGHELLYYPGETNMMLADIAIINKVDSAQDGQIETVRRNIEKHAPQATMVLAESQVLADNAEQIKGKRVLVVEDGPTLTHGEMTFGAGVVAAQRNEAAELVEPKPYAHGSIINTYNKYPHMKTILPAMGYSDEQISDLERTINNTDCDMVLFATPIDLPRLVNINKPAVRVRYEYQDHSEPYLEEVLLKRLRRCAP